jgi:hypothetical protein
MTGKNSRETTSLTQAEAEVLGELAAVAGLTRSALIRLLCIDGLRRYAPERLPLTVVNEAKLAKFRLTSIADEAQDSLIGS